MEREKRLKCTAYHEAGHAVASYFMGRKFKKVVLQIDQSPPGYIEYTKRKKYTSYKQLEDDIFISLAGPAAESVFTGKMNWYRARFDLESARRLYGSCKYKEVYIFWTLHRAETFIRDNWRCVDALALELIRVDKLAYQKVRNIIYKSLFYWNASIPELRDARDLTISKNEA